jgi:glycosyltransferase involved in cell wall biosynthesis
MEVTPPRHEPRRILVITPWADFWSMPGKAGVSDDAEFVRRALAAGHTLHFVLPAGGKFDTAEQDPRLHLHPFPDVFARWRWLPTPLRRLVYMGWFLGPVVRRARRVAAQVKPELVLGFSYHGARAAEVVGRERRIPSVVKHFGVYTAAFFDRWPRWKYRYKNLETLYGLTRKVDRLVILNDGTRGREVALHAGAPPERVVQLLNGIHTEWAQLGLDRAAERARLGVAPGEAAILFLARLAPFKGTQQLMRVLPRLLADASRPLRVLVAGSGEDEPWMRAAAARLPDPERVRFLGAVPHDQVPALFAAADCFLTLNTYSNGSIPTCEAMVMGCPVIATAVAGTGEFVRDGVNGRLVPPDDDEALLAALRDTLADDAARARLARGARDWAAAHFDSWDTRVGRELNLIDELCAEGRTVGD